MSTKVLAQTITELERRVADLETKITKPRDRWKKTVGAAKEDRYFPEAIRLGAKWRKQANRQDW